MSSEIKIIFDDDKRPVVITFVNGTAVLNDNNSACLEQAVTRALAVIKKFMTPKSDKPHA